MAHPTTVAHLFLKEPLSWGLRGDPWLWRAMRDRLEDVPMPATLPEMEALLERAFEEEAGAPLGTAERIFVERFAHGGMSSGVISADWWRGTGIPALVKRWAHATSR